MKSVLSRWPTQPTARAAFAAAHQIPADRQFESWEPLLALPQLADAALVATQDWQHVEPAVAALKAGYHVLLEKPMATNMTDCNRLVQASQESGRQLHICHVLRYTGHIRLLRELVQSGVIGDVVDVDHRENVSFWHMAHSYVRGNWRRSEQTSPMILAKCCHDLDMLPWVLGSRP
jgi:predicted dehydrogenase